VGAALAAHAPLCTGADSDLALTVPSQNARVRFTARR